MGGYAGGNKKQAFIYSLTFVSGPGPGDVRSGSHGVADGHHVWRCGSLLVFCGGGHPHGHGAYNLPASSNSNWAATPKGFSPSAPALIGALILGACYSAWYLSPCASPVLAVILTLAAVQGKVAYGSTLLFAYALGQGTLVILAGTFTGVIESFLQSKGAQFGTAMQKVAGGLIFFMGAYIFFQGIRSL